MANKMSFDGYGDIHKGQMRLATLINIIEERRAVPVTGPAGPSAVITCSSDVLKDMKDCVDGRLEFNDPIGNADTFTKRYKKRGNEGKILTALKVVGNETKEYKISPAGLVKTAEFGSTGGSGAGAENHSRHFKIAKRNIGMSPWNDLVDLRNEELNDDTEIILASSIILDIPNPWDIIFWAQKSIRVGGFLISYVPTVNQVQKLVDSMENWKEIETVEIIQRTWQSKPNALRPQSNTLGHTGFIISARWNG